MTPYMKTIFQQKKKKWNFDQNQWVGPLNSPIYLCNYLLRLGYLRMYLLGQHSGNPSKNILKSLNLDQLKSIGNLYIL